MRYYQKDVTINVNRTGDKLMAVTRKSARTQCYIHEMRQSLDLPYERHKYHVCLICQSRLLELARANFHFSYDQHVTALSVTPKIQKATA